MGFNSGFRPGRQSTSSNLSGSAGLQITGSVDFKDELTVMGKINADDDLIVKGAASFKGSTTLGDAGGDSVTVNAATVTLPNVGTDTDNTVLILNGSNQIKKRDIDGRVWGTSLAGTTNGVNNRIATFTDANDINGEANLTFDGSTLTVAGSVVVNTSNANAKGAGFGATANVSSHIEKRNGHIVSTFYVDLQNLRSNNGANHIIGTNAGSDSYFTRVTKAINGTVYRVLMVCIEAPDGGAVDIDLYSNQDEVNTGDNASSAGSNQIQLINGGSWAIGNAKEGLGQGGTWSGLDDDYLYLAHGSGGLTNADLTQGKYMIKLYGVADFTGVS